MNVPFSRFSAPNQFMQPQLSPEEEEQRRQRLAQASRPVSAPAPTALAKGGIGGGGNPWGENKTCLGLKILCGCLGAVVLILVVVLIVKMVHRGGDSQALVRSPAAGDDQLPMSLAGGFDPMGESLLSTE